MWSPFPHLSMTNEGNICYKHGVCWCNVVLSKPHHCIKDKNHTLGPWLWSMQTDYWFEYQKAHVWQHKNLDLICITGPHALHTAKGNIVSYEHVNIQRVPNQTVTPNTMCSVFQASCSWTTTLWVQMSNIYIIVSAIFPTHNAQSAPQQSGKSPAAVMCFQISENTQLVILWLYFCLNSYKHLSPETKLRQKTHGVFVADIQTSLLFWLMWRRAVTDEICNQLLLLLLKRTHIPTPFQSQQQSLRLGLESDLGHKNTVGSWDISTTWDFKNTNKSFGFDLVKSGSKCLNTVSFQCSAFSLGRYALICLHSTT